MVHKVVDESMSVKLKEEMMLGDGDAMAMPRWLNKKMQRDQTLERASYLSGLSVSSNRYELKKKVK